MEDIQKLICISCPVGCTLMVTVDGETVIQVDGESCKKGIEYAENEIRDPRRMIASTVRVKKGIHPLAPVYTERPIPKPIIKEVLEKLREIELTAPIEHNKIIIENVLGTGVNIIASRDIPAA
jgi:CxxC motif-containing protein